MEKIKRPLIHRAPAILFLKMNMSRWVATLGLWCVSKFCRDVFFWNWGTKYTVHRVYTDVSMWVCASVRKALYPNISLPTLHLMVKKSSAVQPALCLLGLQSLPVQGDGYCQSIWAQFCNYTDLTPATKELFGRAI